MSWMDKMKKAGNTVVNAGAKTMLKTDIVFLEREIKNRKQTFGIEIYDLMEELENDDDLAVAEKEGKIRAAFDAARKDIAVIQAKKECKKEEMAVLEAEAGGGGGGNNASYDIPPADGVVITNEHPSQTQV
mmetsp:Transcript_22176/g.28693  ORF Transcript_22176/g.28693 Transcript_22176/m.28693 type:complete len:131 (-) Transcript_22176:283-675(-)|eukprot:CAMPEP_0198142140 /NCGR_PEP_ID=MMETSP1443-20131203/5019_1 /TAXON_ID=186043 /ORGANISM="Entomoneis sp., Strain CCMP2396" /LENGTH=130 /DNA_ID=CAMNT_0043805095 /DNA_START=216 /DNA_END=608 /DNA_ORIENTATION=+